MMRPHTEPPNWALPDLETSSGCFETMRVYAGAIFRLPAHLERLSASAQSLGVRLPESPAQLSRRLNGAVRRSGLQEAVIRVAMIPRLAAAAEGGSVRSTGPFGPAKGGGTKAGRC